MTTSIHLHGIFQKGSPFQDGVHSVTQCPIPSLNTQPYILKVEQSGTYWWHSHVGYQYSEGIWGPLNIDNKPEVHANQYDDEIIIALSDWYHTSGSVNTNWHPPAMEAHQFRYQLYLMIVGDIPACSPRC